MDVGDWVTSYSKGIWQVYRVLDGFYDARFSLDDPKELFDGPLLFVRRLANEKWTRSFSVECVHRSLVKRITKAGKKKLDAFIAKNAGVFAEFQTYSKPLDSILNLGFGLPRSVSYRQFAKDSKAAFSSGLKRGMTSDEILRVIAKSKYERFYSEMPNTATLQFVCRDHETRKAEAIYRDLNVHAF